MYRHPVVAILALCVASFSMGRAQVSASGPDLTEWGMPKVQPFYPRETGIRGDIHGLASLPGGELAVLTSIGLVTFDGSNWERVPGIGWPIGVARLEDGRAVFSCTGGMVAMSSDEFGGYTTELLTPDESKGKQAHSPIAMASVRGWTFGLLGIELVTIDPEGTIEVKRLPNWASGLFAIGDDLYFTGGLTSLLNKWDFDSQSLVDVSNVLDGSVYEWMIDNCPRTAGGAWILTQNHKIIGFDGAISWIWPGTAEIQKRNLFVTSILELQSGLMAVGTASQGLLIFDRAGKLVYQIGKNRGLDDANVLELAEDAQGGVWVATKRSLVRVETRASIFLFDDRHGLPEIIRVLEIFDGRLFVGGPSGLFVSQSTPTSPESVFVQITELQSVSDLLVHDGNLFVAADKLAIIDKRGDLKVLDERGATNLFQPSSSPDTIIVGYFDGAMRIDRDGAGWKAPIPIPGECTEIFSFAEARDGSIFGSLGTSRVARLVLEPFPGLARMEDVPFRNSGTWSSIANIEGELYLNDNPALRWDSETDSWLASPEMIYYVGGPPYGFEGVFGYDRENAWVALSRHRSDTIRRPSSNVISSIASLGNAIETRATCAVSDDQGNIWAGGPFGLVYASSIAQREESLPPPPRFHRFVSMRDGALLPIDPIPGAPLQLQPHQRSLRIEVEFSNFAAAAHSVYQIFVEGIDTQWPEPTNIAFRELTNLRPGPYIIRVNARDTSGRYIPAADYPFVLVAPWYERPWAFAIYIAGLVLIFFAALSYYTRAQVRRSRRLEDTVKERTQEIELKNHELERQAAALERQNEELSETTEELQTTTESLTEALQRLHGVQDQLVATARTAGKAEIATNVLHNVGNVLNSINVSLSVLSQKVADSKIARLAHLAKLVESHLHEIGSFITSDAKGKLVPDYLLRISQSLVEENAALAYEIDTMTQDVEHVKRIIAAQQTHASSRNLLQTFSLCDLCQTALSITLKDTPSQPIEVIAEIDSGIHISSDKHRVLDILLNLFSNARDAIEHEKPGLGILSITSSLSSSQVTLTITDNGCGIDPSHQDMLFNHGFTTKSDGHGFGLHSSANAARALGGNLSLASQGPRQGATATLVLPLRANVETPEYPETGISPVAR